MKTGALILAAGFSSRMGVPKALLKIGDLHFIEHLVAEFKKFACDKICIVSQKEILENLNRIEILHSENIIIKTNSNPENGRFSSLKIGFSELKTCDYIFIQNVDNPFANNDLLNSLMNSLPDNELCVPTFKEKGGHPILITKKIACESENFPDDTVFKEYLKSFKRINYKTHFSEILQNINNPEEYAEFLERSHANRHL